MRIHQILAANAVLAAVYFIAGRFGLTLAFLQESATAVWPPTGLALAAILLFGWRLLPGVFAGAFFVNITTNGSLAVVLGIAVGNTLEAAAGGWLALKFAGGVQAFQRAGTTLRFVACATLPATMVSASIGVLSLCLGGFATWDKFTSIWLTWWLGDFVSALIITPLLITWTARQSNISLRKHLPELGLLTGTLLFVSGLVFENWSSVETERFPFDFLLIPGLLWAAYRFEQRGAASASFLVSAIAIFGTLKGLGPFAVTDRNTALLLLQGFMGTITVTSLVLAALVSERRLSDESRRLYQQIFLNSIDGIAVIRPDGSYLEQNSSHLQMLGYGDDELVEKTPEAHLGPEQFATIVEALGKQGQYRGEVVSRRKDGREIPVEISAFTVRDEEQRVVCHVGIKRDISSRKAIEENLQRAEAELRQYARELESRVADRTEKLSASVKSLESFCYSIAHDLRAPLRGIHGLCSVIRDDYGSHFDSAGLEYLLRIFAAVERLDRLIQDLLEYGRINKEENTGTPTDLARELEALRSELKLEIEQRGAVIEVLSPLPRLAVNSAIVGQIFRNLLTNALKFVPAGTQPHIKIWAEPGPGKMRIAIRDNGIGIKPEHHERIFRLFERLHSEQDYPGTGLGLALVKKGVEGAGGTISVESQHGQGSCFFLEFPSRMVSG